MPVGIALIGNKEIAVVDRLNHRVQFFDLEGKFLRQLGRYGSREGEFDFPATIAWLPNARNKC